MRIQISLKAKKLKNVAGLFKGTSDPYAVVTREDTGDELGRTETFKDQLNPTWAETIIFNTFDNTSLFLKVSIYDDNFQKEEDKLIGDVLFPLEEVLNSTASGEETKEKLTNGNGKVIMFAHVSTGESAGKINLKFRGLDVKNIEGGGIRVGRTDPFFEISKKFTDPLQGHIRWQVVYRSEEFMDHLNPVWRSFSISLEKLCGGDLHKDIKIELWDWQKRGKHRMIGEFETTVFQLCESVALNCNADRDRAFTFTASKGKNDKVGVLVVLEAELVP